MQVRLGFRHELWAEGVKRPIVWDTEKVPHIMVAGITGGCKTVLSQMILNQMIGEFKVTICDFKAGGDWDGIVDDYYEYIECDVGLKQFHEAFCKTIAVKGHENRILIFDEISSYALSKDSKEYKEMNSMLSHLAFMSRSFGYHLMLISQQFNSKVIDTAIREQFGIKIYMGSTISTESASMLFPGVEIDKGRHLPPYCGYVSMPGSDVDIIQIPYIDNPDMLKELLKQKARIRGT